MSTGDLSDRGSFLAETMIPALASLQHDPPANAPLRGVTSDLTIDEALLIHSIGWEPVDLVCGVSIGSIPSGIWAWGTGEIVQVSQAYANAVAAAADRLERECSDVGGHGIVGVHVELTLHHHHVDAVLVGTAVRPAGAKGKVGKPFVSDLSARDFCLLDQAGWDPVGLAFGASFVHAPRRGAGAALKQSTQNVELTNFTEALYSAREAAMDRMQSSALAMGATGVVAVHVFEGPVPFAGHAIGFTAYGTAVTLRSGGHQYLRPQVVLPLDDQVRSFEVTALRGAAPAEGAG